MSGLEERSGSKTLLKLLLENSNKVLTQSKINDISINNLQSDVIANQELLILIKKQLELITGVHKD